MNCEAESSNIFSASDAVANALEIYQAQILFQNLFFIVRYNLYPQKTGPRFYERPSSKTGPSCPANQVWPYRIQILMDRI